MIKELFRSSGIHFLGLTINKVLGVIVFLLFARALQPFQFGHLVIFTTMITLVTVLAELGMGQWFQTQAATPQRLATFHAITLTRLLTFVISTLIVAGICIYLHVLPDWAISFLIVNLFAEAFISLADSYYFALHQIHFISFKNISRVVLLLLGYLLMSTTFSIYFAFLLITVVTCLTAVWYFPKFPWKGIPTFSWKKSSEIIVSAAPYGVLMTTSLTYARGDSILVQVFQGPTALGFYGAAYRYLEGISLLPTAVFQTLFPRAAQLKNIEKAHLITITLIMLICGLMTAAALYFAAPLLTVGLLGSAYQDTVPIVQVLSGVVVLFFLNAPLSAVVQSSRLVKKFLPYGMGNTALNIGLNCVMIPLLGPIGAAWTMLITELTGFLINFYFTEQLYTQKK